MIITNIFGILASIFRRMVMKILAPKLCVLSKSIPKAADDKFLPPQSFIVRRGQRIWQHRAAICLVGPLQENDAHVGGVEHGHKIFVLGKYAEVAELKNCYFHKKRKLKFEIFDIRKRGETRLEDLYA